MRTFPEAEPCCFDCHTEDFIDPVIRRVIQYSVPGRIFCEPCYRWRAKRLLEFDPRPRRQLEQADRHAEVFARR